MLRSIDVVARLDFDEVCQGRGEHEQAIRIATLNNVPKDEPHKAELKEASRIAQITY